MQKTVTRALTGLALAAAAFAAQAQTLNVVGINAANKIVRFTTATTGGVTVGASIVGLNPNDTTIIGADYRVQDGKLYVVGLGGGVYSVDTNSGQATAAAPLTVALSGGSFGVDFNPAADRLRIVSENGQNLRHNVNAGGTTATDDALDYPPATPANTSGPNANFVIATAYTNNDLSTTTGTTQFGVDTLRDQAVVQNPPNNGSLAATGLFNFNADTTQASLDIFSKVVNGVTVSNTAYAVLNVGGNQGLYQVDLLTGTPKFIKALSTNVVSIAIPLNQ